jgi:hypothetical protein
MVEKEALVAYISVWSWYLSNQEYERRNADILWPYGWFQFGDTDSFEGCRRRFVTFLAFKMLLSWIVFNLTSY